MASCETTRPDSAPIRCRRAAAILGHALLLALIVSAFPARATAQVQSLCIGFDPAGQPIDVPESVYVGDSRMLTFEAGKGRTSAQIASVAWTYKVTTPSGQTESGTIPGNPNNPQQWTVTFGALGTYELTGTYTYNFDSAGKKPDPNPVKATVVVKPPTGVVFDPGGNPPNPDPATIYNIDMGGGDYYFKIIGVGGSNSGENMKGAEKISFSVPAGKADAFGGEWGWNQGGLPGIPPTNAPWINIDSTGRITDTKRLTSDWNDPNVPNGQPLMKYTQTVGVRILDMLGQPNYIPLGQFTVEFTRVNATQFTLTITKL